MPKAVLMVSSYLPELLGVCDRVAVMCRGRLGPARPVAGLDEHRLMLEATGAAERGVRLGRTGWAGSGPFSGSSSSSALFGLLVGPHFFRPATSS